MVLFFVRNVVQEYGRGEIMFCKYCGKEINDASEFCQYCGKKLNLVIDTEIPKPSVYKEDEAASRIVGSSDGNNRDIIKENPFVDNISVAEQKEKRSFNKRILIIPLVLVLIIVSGFGIAMHAYNLADSGDFDGAAKYSTIVFWDNDFGKYVSSGIDLNHNRYSSAIGGFADLGDYRKSKEYYAESVYRDSVDRYNSGKYLEAYEGFAKIPNHNDSNSYISQIKNDAYDNGVKAYNSGSLSRAEKFFNISDAKDSFVYLKIIDVANGSSDISSLKTVVEYNIVKKFLLKNDDNAIGFLEGQWNTGDNYYYFKAEDKGDTYNISYNLPNHNYSGYFTIENGVYFIEDENGSNKRTEFELTVDSWNKLYIKCTENGNTYALYRN